MPRAESDELKKSIIRTTIKNENLLAKLMEKAKIRKKFNKKLNNSLRHKADRSTKVEGVLATKIQQSIERAKYIQRTRKSGWDQINRTLNMKLSKERKESVLEKTKEDADQEAEDEYVRNFYADVGGVRIEKSEVVQQGKVLKPANMFWLLEEIDS